MDEEVGYPRRAERGRTYVYVLPCRDEDLLKVGFSRDPLDRFRTLHSRFYEFFDLDRGLLIETDRLRDARRIERLFIETFVDYRVPAPLVVPKSAAGHTEWYRGIDPLVNAVAREVSLAEGFMLHAPLRPWLRDRLDTWSDRLYQWASTMLDAVEYENFNSSTNETERSLRNVLDMYSALGVDVQGKVSAQVFDWYMNPEFFGPRS